MPKVELTREGLERALDDAPFQRWLGLTVEELDAESGSVTLRLPFKPELARSSERPELHGGVTSALIDIAGDYALAVSLGGGVPTVDLRVDFLRMAVGTDLLARARVIKAGRTLSVVNVEVEDQQGRLIAVGRGTYFTKRS